MLGCSVGLHRAQPAELSLFHYTLPGFGCWPLGHRADVRPAPPCTPAALCRVSAAWTSSLCCPTWQSRPGGSWAHCARACSWPHGCLCDCSSRDREGWGGVWAPPRALLVSTEEVVCVQSLLTSLRPLLLRFLPVCGTQNTVAILFRMTCDNHDGGTHLCSHGPCGSETHCWRQLKLCYACACVCTCRCMPCVDTCAHEWAGVYVHMSVLCGCMWAGMHGCACMFLCLCTCAHMYVLCSYT